MKLNIGCGKDIKEGYINCDYINSEGVDKVFDMNKYPWPFSDNSIDEILCISILEHLDNPEKAIKEMWRISKPNCQITIEVPHFSSWSSWGDITHKRPFNSTSLLSFSHLKKHRISKTLLNSHKEVFEVKSKIIFGKIKKFFLFSLIFNMNNYSKGFYERHLCYIFPAGGLVFKLRVIK
jgi:predicted SAM-dependent methyltransferase